MKTILSLIAAVAISSAGIAFACDGAGADNGKTNSSEKQTKKDATPKDGKAKKSPPAQG